MTINGTSGDDVLTGTAGADTFTMTQGGNDSVSGLGGNDVFNFGAVFNSNDLVDGGAGVDTLKLSGDYAGPNDLFFGTNALTSVEQILLGAGHSYQLIMGDGTVAAGQTLVINGSALGAGDMLNVSGGLESDGMFDERGGAGADLLGGGQLNDKLYGFAGDDFLNSGTGVDTLDGGDGNDAVLFTGTAVVTGDDGNDLLADGGVWNANNRINGGAGSDGLSIEVAGTVTFNAANLVSVEQLYFTALSGNYTVTMNDGNVAAGTQLYISAESLTAGQSLFFNGSHETDGSFQIFGGSGDDVMTGGAGNDVFEPSAGSDHINGGAGDDVILMDGNLDNSDRITGGGGTDSVRLNGDYSAGVVLGGATITGIAAIELGNGHSYSLTANDGNVAAGATMTVDAGGLGQGQNFAYNASHETDGHYQFVGGAGDNVISGGALADQIVLGDGNTQLSGGVDTVNAGAGDDVIAISNYFDVHDKINGGDGNDTVTFQVDSATPLVFTTSTLTNVETLEIVGISFTSIAVRDQAVAAGQTLTVNGASLSGALGGVTSHFTFNGALETDGKFIMLGGDGNDTLIGGAGADSFTGGPGADSITGGAGADTFIYTNVTQSSVNFTDIITGFDALADKFDLPVAVNGIDAGVSGAASTNSLVNDLTTAIGTGQLAAGHALLFTATSGTLSGDTFLIVDGNGSAGYQVSDMVFQLSGAVHLANLTTGDFI